MMWSRLALSAAWSIALVGLIAGCGGGGLVPVTGKVLSGDTPLSNGTVTFHPDQSQGNESTKRPEGLIESDGTYTLYTDQTEGAPVGWYKVTVFAQEAAASAPEGEEAYAVPKFLVPEEYTIETQTPLSIEVKAGASQGDYDLKVEPAG